MNANNHIFLEKLMGYFSARTFSMFGSPKIRLGSAIVRLSARLSTAPALTYRWYMTQAKAALDSNVCMTSQRRLISNRRQIRLVSHACAMHSWHQYLKTSRTAIVRVKSRKLTRSYVMAHSHSALCSRPPPTRQLIARSAITRLCSG